MDCSSVAEEDNNTSLEVTLHFLAFSGLQEDISIKNELDEN